MIVSATAVRALADPKPAPVAVHNAYAMPPLSATAPTMPLMMNARRLRLDAGSRRETSFFMTNSIS